MMPMVQREWPMAVTSGRQFQVEFDDGPVHNFRDRDLQLLQPTDEGFAGGQPPPASAAAQTAPQMRTKYSVQLPCSVDGSAAGGSMDLDEDRVRPAWEWAGSKWVGRWIPKAKSKRREQKEAAFAQMQLDWPLGTRLEVWRT